MLRFKHIIWDFDGTLFDTYPHIAFVIKEIINENYNIDLNVQQIQSWCKISLNYCFEKVATVFTLEKTKLQELFNVNYVRNIESQQPPFPGAIEMVQFIYKNGGKNYIITHRGPLSLNRLLEYNNIQDYFKKIITQKDGFPNKPDPTSFLYLTNYYEIPKEEVIAIGDRDIDIQTASKIGIKACYFNPEGKNNGLADYNIKNLLELRGIIFNDLKEKSL
ncbi:MAG: HAD family hydrolase [Candidatus Thorarchaeota archaeon]